MSYPAEVSDFFANIIARSPKTRENYESFARNFWKFVGKKSVQDVTIEDIMAFLNNGSQKLHWEISTVKQYGTIALLFFREFRDEAFVKKLRRQISGLPRTQSRAALYEGVYIPSEKIDEFIQRAPNEEWAVFYTMILKWGLRLSEALSIPPRDVNPVSDRIVVRGKGGGGMGKVRQVFVEKSTITRALKFAGCSQEQINGEKIIRDETPIIKSITERTAEYQWKITAKSCHLKHWAQLTPHDGRHSYAIDFLMKRKAQGMAALVLLKNQLGHANIQTTTIYLDIAGGDAEEVFKAGLTENNSETL